MAANSTSPSAAVKPLANISVPINIDAFVLSEKSCDADLRIAPITQPNYMGLRLDSSLIQHDLLEHIDFHNTKSPLTNPRLADVGSNPPAFRDHRLGVHVHWTLPRYYRSGNAVNPASGSKQDRQAGSPDSTQPVFPKVPNRWLLVRRLIKSVPTVTTSQIPQLQAWLIESDRLRKIITSTAKEDLAIDLESDVTPFVAYKTDSKDANNVDALSVQAEVFIGKRSLLNDAKLGTDDDYINLTVMNSSNPLFPDYALHNFSVFSTIDDFSYKSNPDDVNSSTLYLTEATADYYVLGWHSSANDDPLAQFGVPKTDTLKLKDRLSKMLLKMEAGKSTSLADQDKSFENTRTLFHGTMYSVVYNRKARTPSAADEIIPRFKLPPPADGDKNGQKPDPKLRMEPLSVGSTAIDAIVTFLEAHKDDTAKIFGADLSREADDILSLSQLLYSADDSYNARIKASDLLLQNNFAPATGGNTWVYASPQNQKSATSSQAGVPKAGTTDSQTPPDQKKLTQPTPEDIQSLYSLNQDQARLDTASRMLEQSKWNLFAEWWKFVSDQENRTSDARKKAYTDGSARFASEVARLDSLVTKLQSQIDTKKMQTPCKSAPSAPYFQRKDPTLCIAGLESGWPSDYLSKQTVRLDDKLLSDERVSSLEDSSAPFKGLLASIKSALAMDDSLKSSVRRLLGEAFDRNTGDLGNNITGFKQWTGKNPFVPLFVEYEVIYFHIDFQEWDVRLRSSPVGHTYDQVRYGLRRNLQDIKKLQDKPDYRTASGRVMILPQPVFSLEALINAVIDTAGVSPLSKDESKFLQDHVSAMKFISAPLQGLTNHLLTRIDGSHVTPTVRAQGQTPVVLEAAVKAGRGTNPATGQDVMNRDDVFNNLKVLDNLSGLTPYGNLMSFGADYPGVPFKGVTSGQIAFTKLNIVDKFGQAICVIDPLPRPNPRLPGSTSQITPPPAIYPCISDYMCPDILDDGTPNTVFREASVQKGEWPLCRFMQLTPSINQPARINAKFVLPPDGINFTTWHQATDFEQPIFAWIVVNYANSGLQFFLPDGTFYREVRMGGVTGTNTGAKWLPFDPPDPPASTSSNQSAQQPTQLDMLIRQLTDPTDLTGEYLQGFFDMINGSIVNMPYPPSDYSSYANAIVGKPLALVNVGFSLELAAPALRAQNTLGRKPVDEQKELENHEFHYKIGDLDRPFDGVVGYYDAVNDDNAKEGTLGTTLFRELFTYFVPTPQTRTGRKITPIKPSNFPILKPYYINPLDNDDMLKAHFSKLQVKTMIVDPYTAIHAYSPILPITSLQLPAWTIQSAMKRMTAFFRMGPALLSRDVPDVYDADHPLKPDTWITLQSNAAVAAAAVQADPKPADVKLPISGSRGLWNWLQPYEKEDPNDVNPRYNSLTVDQQDTRLRHDPAPYTFVEGYLHLARPLIKEDIGV